MRIVRAAVVQDSPIVFNREATIEKVHSLVSQAARQGATLVVMPEAFVRISLRTHDFNNSRRHKTFRMEIRKSQKEGKRPYPKLDLST